jgi:hypothetical protein
MGDPVKLDSTLANRGADAAHGRASSAADTAKFDEALNQEQAPSQKATQMSSANRGVPSFEVPLFPFLDAAKHGIKAQIEADDRPVLALLPNGVGYVGPAWKAEVEKHEIGQQMAWERALQTGSNLTGLVGALSYGAATAHHLDGDAFSDLGSFGDLGLQLCVPHPLNSQSVVNAPPDYHIHGAPTHESYSGSNPPVGERHIQMPSAPRRGGGAAYGASRTIPNLSAEIPSAKQIEKALSTASKDAAQAENASRSVNEPSKALKGKEISPADRGKQPEITETKRLASEIESTTEPAGRTAKVPVRPTAEAVKRSEIAVTDIVMRDYGHLGVRDISDLSKSATTPGVDRLFIIGKNEGAVLVEVDAKLSIQETATRISHVSSFETAAETGGASRSELLDAAFKSGKVSSLEYDSLKESIDKGLVLEEVHGFGSVVGISEKLKSGQVVYRQGETFAHVSSQIAERESEGLSTAVKVTIIKPKADRRSIKTITDQIWKDFEKAFGPKSP